VSRRDHFETLWRTKVNGEDDPLTLQRNLRVIKAVSLLSRGDRLLDIGCGAGALGTVAAGLFHEVHGLDISTDAVDLAKRQGVLAQVVDLGSGCLPYPDKRFDAVTALSVLQYIVDPDTLLQECKRVLRPGGQFIACVPNMRAAWRLWRLAVQGRFPRTSLDQVGLDGGTLHYFTTRTAADLFAHAGLRVVSAHGIFCVPRAFENRVTRGLLGTLKREFACAEVLITCLAEPLARTPAPS
jgi:SAM-dependent methyltransferase